MLDSTFQYCASIAEKTSVFEPADATPDNGFLASVVPVDPAEYFATIAADNNLRKAMGTTKSSFLATGAGVNDSATGKLGSGLNYLLTHDMIILVMKMTRKPRIHYPGALYHVMVRGNNGEKILSEVTHKKKYLDILTLYKEKIGFKIYAYCIMDNHAHFLIEVTDTPLSEIMQRIQQVYTQCFNRKHSRTGHVFQQRYKALLCDKENYLLQLIKYIHNNPVKANLENGIEYQWSSHICYIRKKKSDIVDTSYVLSMFSEDINKAIKQYLQFMNQDEEEIKYIDINECQSTNLSVKKANKELIKKTNIDEIIEEVCKNENITIDDITRKIKIQKISDIRKAIVLLGEKYCNASNKILAQKLNISSSMISKIKSGDSKGTAYVKEVIERWEGISK